MPRRKRFSRKRRTRTKRRTRRISRRRRRFRIPSAIKPRNTVIMRYCDQDVPLSSTSGSMATKLYNAMNPFLPKEGGTHQPRGYNQMAQWWNHYVVLGAVCRVYVTGGQNAQGHTGCYLDADAIPLTTTQDFIEMKRGRWTTIQHDRTAARSRCYYSAKKFFKVKDVKDNVERLGAPINESPLESAFFVIWFAASGTETHLLNAVVIIDYVVQFSEPKDIPASAIIV